ncbi:efflux RND transporter periplasmic adaptor subunit [Candidatus Kuenenbacteria bacterium]|nr:efflux RND transporter periplasmic adaptor subunit [Candidatus Kuenenbacteria bacterium]
MKKKKIIVAVVVIAVIIFAVLIFGSKKTTVSYTTAKAEIGTVIQTVDVTGSVASAEDINLNFKNTGKITTIKVKVGDKVKTGDLLATLDTAALASRVADANSALIEAQANLEKIISGATPEDIRISEINVDQKKQDLASAENNLTNLELNRETELKNLKNTAIASINNQIIVAEHAIQTAKDTLKDDDAEDTLGILNRSSITTAANSEIAATSAVNYAKTRSDTLGSDSPDETVLSVINDTKKALDGVRQYLSDAFSVLAATITSSDLTQTELDALIGNIQTEQSNISTAKTTLQTAEANWTNKIVYYTDQLAKLKNLVVSAKDSLALAEAQLALKKAKPQSYDIKSAEAGVAKARASLALAEANLSDVIIKAPVDGVITEVNNKIGEQNSLTTPVIKMIGDSKLEIEANIPESDIAKVKAEQKAEITLDSFGEEQIFPGVVTFVNPAEKIIQDVVYYEVKVQFNENIDSIKPGMTANVIMETDKVENVLRVPLRAVKQKNGVKIVEVLVNGLPQEKTVTTGLRGDEYMEILSGINEGEDVITFTKTK